MVKAKVKIKAKARAKTLPLPPPARPSQPDYDMVVDEDGKVLLKVDLEFEEPISIRVAPELAQRFLDGEFQDVEVGEVDGVDLVGALEENHPRVSVQGAYEAKLKPRRKAASE